MFDKLVTIICIGLGTAEQVCKMSAAKQMFDDFIYLVANTQEQTLAND